MANYDIGTQKEILACKVCGYKEVPTFKVEEYHSYTTIPHTTLKDPPKQFHTYKKVLLCVKCGAENIILEEIR